MDPGAGAGGRLPRPAAPLTDRQQAVLAVSTGCTAARRHGTDPFGAIHCALTAMPRLPAASAPAA
ncbi:hypothetical protein GCM10009663_52450 [Kitasatospora arboriphila]|uniref:Uncharacterized protein n=1 Tax=Kitasatospora arboriphila TaxID=258052 RepID=A0ABP4EG68_9ACTN